MLTFAQMAILPEAICDLEIQTQSRLPATFRVVRQDAKELVLEFEVRNSTEGCQPWMEKAPNRQRLTIGSDSSAIRIENELLNADSQPHSVARLAWDPVVTHEFRPASVRQPGIRRAGQPKPPVEPEREGVFRMLNWR
jgi:hypothetical protein